MSRTDQFKKKTNPAEASIEWAGSRDDGFFKFYDKAKKENIPVKAIRFAVLAERNCVRGWYEEKNSNAFSNEVSSLKNQVLTVRYFEDGKSRELISGKYEDIKDGLQAKGIKYNKVIYSLVLESDVLEVGTIIKIILKGGAASKWFDVKDKAGSVSVQGFTDEKNGAVKYRVPVFVTSAIDEAESEEAEFAYEQVNVFLSATPHTTPHHDDVPHDVIDAGEDLVPLDDSDNVPF